MTKNQIYCKKCNAKFNSMLGFLHHNCPNESKAPEWGKHGIGRRGLTKERNIVKGQMEDHWLEDAEEQRTKNKSRNVYKKNYRGKQNENK